MRGRVRTICASGVFLLALVGCNGAGGTNSLTQINAAASIVSGSPADNGDHTVSGSAEVVAQLTEGSLRQLGFDAVRTSDSNSIRIASNGAHGAGCSFVLTTVHTQSGDQTRVHVDYENGADHTIGQKLVAALDVKTSGTTTALAK